MADMNTKYGALFTPWKIGNVEIKNRIVMCPVLASVWLDNVNMPVIDNLGYEFLNYVKTGMTVTVGEDEVVTVE